ncbi:MAG: RcnB family protein [Gammaproteobacteria bacterium]|nr:RcnB family protein [Gammaproteobacteria bacterium]MBU1777420.1 RcnB family protein [Gammaproteobacteria bacterium]MBU1969117.1 RcnB family protein [Gammaproteobacteria bacterium]
MQLRPLSTIPLLSLAFAALLASTPAFADKPDWAGKDKDQKQAEKHKRNETHTRDSISIDVSLRFDDRQRKVAREYFSGEVRSGRCPPGLAKKNNGCLPPGQAKKWAVGKALPKGVVIYDLPAKVTVKLGIPPEGHKYVRVASDILLIAVGTAMVVDAIEDLHDL